MKKTFTLIELLIVIGIVTLLAGLLIPVHGDVRGAAEAASCLGNLKQIGSGLMMYIENNNDWQPVNNYAWTGNGSNSFRNSFGALLAPYVEPDFRDKGYAGNAPAKYQTKVFRCSADPTAYRYWPNSYGAVNGNIMPQATAANGGIIQITKLKNPAGTMCIMDAAPMRVSDTDIRPGTFIRTIGVYFKGAWNTTTSAGAQPLLIDTNNNGIKDSNKAAVPFNGAAFRHDNMINAVYCDGHVDTLDEAKWANEESWGR